MRIVVDTNIVHNAELKTKKENLQNFYFLNKRNYVMNLNA